jgi:SAM-dependent methyltransferase
MDANKYVIDDKSGAEMARLINQDRMITRAMGDLFPPIDLDDIRNVLDIGCGPGGWVRDVAFAYKRMAVLGIDINKEMIRYANAFAEVGKLDNAQYEVQDATCTLDFPDASFDFINARLVASFVQREDDWQNLLAELARVVRPGGVIRLIECDDLGETNSPAFERMNVLMEEAWRKDQRPPRVIRLLPDFLAAAGCQDIQTREHIIDFSVDRPEYATMRDNIRVAFHLLQPFLYAKGVATREELDQLYQWTLIEMMGDGFEGKWRLGEAWGRKSTDA